jgi:hypothetical protein
MLVQKPHDPVIIPIYGPILIAVASHAKEERE